MAGTALNILEKPVAKRICDQGIVEGIKGDPYGVLCQTGITVEKLDIQGYLED
jgi:hypothetical protein